MDNERDRDSLKRLNKEGDRDPLKRLNKEGDSKSRAIGLFSSP